MTHAMKKKILFVITKSNWGGAQRYVYDLATHFNTTHDVAVVCGGNGTLTTRLTEASVRVISLPHLTRDVHLQKDVRTFIELMRIIRREHPDVVHLNSSKIGALGAVIGRLLHVPRIIFTAHGWAWNEDRNMLSKIFICMIHYITMLLCHATIAVSESVRSQALYFPGVAKKITVINLGLRNASPLSQEEARHVLPEKTDNTTVLGTVAELHPIKGITYAIEAVHTLNAQNISYVIWGEGEERQRLQNHIEQHSLSANIFLQGHVQNAEHYMRAFDCFVLPSLSEASGYVLLEAGNAGLPVVATRVGGIPEIIEDGKTGLLVPSKDPQALANALTTLIENPALRAQVGSALQRKVRTEFSLERMLTATEALYS